MILPQVTGMGFVSVECEGESRILLFAADIHVMQNIMTIRKIMVVF